MERLRFFYQNQKKKKKIIIYSDAGGIDFWDNGGTTLFLNLKQIKLSIAKPEEIEL